MFKSSSSHSAGPSRKDPKYASLSSQFNLSSFISSSSSVSSSFEDIVTQSKDALYSLEVFEAKKALRSSIMMELVNRS